MQLHQTISYMKIFLFIIADVYGIEEKLLFSTLNNLKEIDLDTGMVRTLKSQSGYIYSMAYNHKERYMYVPRYHIGDIVRFPYPNDFTVVFESIVSASYPVGISFDSVNNHLYWTELYYPGSVMRCNTDGTDLRVILNETQPAAIALDMHNRWIYYGQQILPSQIFRSNFDGMGITVIIKDLPAKVYGLGVDVNVKRLYWMEFQTGDLQSACFNGSDVRTIVSTNAKSKNWDIATDGDFIFYTSSNKIMKISKSLQHNPTVVYTDTDIINGILLYKQNGKNTSLKKYYEIQFILHYSVTIIL
ncbi:protein cueball-like isoform X1 [Mytilus edulis]|uniref:protein cueball-like isoform X1 n=1 Tax=Mytilus edulis TaxID=6550 RepID=UPI0039EE7B3F